MRPPVILWAGFPFTVRLDQKTAEIGNQTVDLFSLLLPPPLYILVQRVGRRQFPKGFRGSKVHRQISPYAIRAQHFGNNRYFTKHSGGKHLRFGVHIIEHHGVNADRSIGTSIFLVQWGNRFGQLVPLPYRTSCVTSLYRPIGIVPMVQDANVVRRSFCHSHTIRQ